MDKKINISLVGGQPFPVYAQILDNQPEIAILVCSDQTEKDAMRIKAVLNHNLPQTGVSLLKISAEDNALANQYIKAQSEIFSKPGHEITINIAGGTKPWSILFAKHFAGKAKLVFIDQNNIIWDMDTLEYHELSPKDVSIEDLAALHGVEFLNKTNLTFYTDQDRALIPRIIEARRWNSGAFQALTSPTGQQRPEAERSGIKWLDDQTCRITLFNPQKGAKTFTLQSPHARSIVPRFAWFELQVALMLSQWPVTKQVWLNSEVALPNGVEALNEIDVIVETTIGKFLFVECKTSVYNPTDIDKFNDVVKKTGGLGAKRIFMTDKPMSGTIAGKCDHAKIPHFAMRQITSNRANQLNFFAALDAYMSNINER